MSPPVGSLVLNTDDQWMVLPPQRCPDGHRLGPHRVLVGHQPCGCGHHGHMTWECRECSTTIYAPPVDDACRVLNGAAFVR
jgi:hypothetical protein